jgi:uncharacterized membrane protein YhhN
MKINNQLFLNLYMVVAIVHIYTLISDNEQYILISKYLLMPMLLLHVIVNCRKVLKSVLPLILGLFFCWVGDVILIYSDVYENFFMFGLAAFLIGHLFYIWSFRRFAFKTTSLLKRKPWILIFPFLYSIILLTIVFPNLGDMKIPVIIYALVITAMCIASINRSGRTNQYSFLFVFAGALFFIGSDSMIAINRFYSEITSGALLIMSTYIIAQYLITTGLLLHITDPENA